MFPVPGTHVWQQHEQTDWRVRHGIPLYYTVCTFDCTINCTHYATNTAFPSSPVEEDMTDELGDSSEPMEIAFTLDQTADGKFLSLDDLGKLLLHLASQGLLTLHMLEGKYYLKAAVEPPLYYQLCI